MSTILRNFLRSPPAAVALALFLLIVLAAIFANWIAPQNPYDLAQIDVLDGGSEPGTRSSGGMIFWLGSDTQGRDMLSAILYGLRISLSVGLVSVVLSAVIGSLIGVLSAYFGGKTDVFIMRVVDIQLSFPSILVALVLLAVAGRGIDKVIFALVLVQWAYYARTVRGSALVEMQKDYVAAARNLALSRARIMIVHLLPNCILPLLVLATLQLGQAIALEATLSFLGVGVPITRPSLGMLIADGFNFLLSGKYWISVFPGIALFVVVVTINLVGDRMREIFNPQLEG